MNRTKILYFSIAGTVLFMLLACAAPKSSVKEKPSTQTEQSIDELSEKVKDVGESIAAQTKITPVAYQELKKLLPKKLRGMKQTDLKGGRNSVLKIRFTRAEGRYEGRKDERITIKVTDFGTIKGIAGRAVQAWMSAEIDNESDSGYERTVEHRGHKGFQKYNYDSKSGKFSLIIAKRFLVEVEGENVSMKAIIKAMDKVNLKKLRKLKDYGVPKK